MHQKPNLTYASGMYDNKQTVNHYYQKAIELYNKAVDLGSADSMRISHSVELIPKLRLKQKHISSIIIDSAFILVT